MVKNQCNKKIKNLRTSNGLEYLADEFTDYCKEHGIRRHKSVRKSPQQNGLAERMNRTLIERVRCMLSNARLPNKFWGEAVHTAAYLVNKLPFAAIDFKTPQEIWSGEPADYSGLKILGCNAYYHVNEGKLEPRAKKGLFMGYPDGVKGFRIWCLESKRCIISRDVTFDEERLLREQEERNSVRIESAMSDRLEFEVEPNGEEMGKTMDSTSQTSSSNSEIGTEDGAQDDLHSYRLVRDRDRREIKAPTRYGYSDLIAYALSVAEELLDDEPKSFHEAIKSNDSNRWVIAMNEKLESLEKNHTWDLVPRPAGSKTVGCKWIFKKKDGIEGVEPARFKARLVARGFTQREGLDYNEIFFSGC